MIVIATNRRAFFDYTIDGIYEAGIVLRGDEVKSIRAKQVSLADSFAIVKDGQVFLLNCHIAPYKYAYDKKDTSRQTRALLLHKKEINKLIGAVSRQGLTLIPLRMYFNTRGFVKVEIGLAKHKKNVDKKEQIKERDIKRETLRESKIRL
ncbi:SsrA-binding protein SmpB [Candidatus Dependentiae bacterium]|nr:SsrA-binding protein SmpB [Candidatus Dependentiae bacterium]